MADLFLMSFVPSIPVLQDFRTLGHRTFFQWEPRTESTQWASPTSHSPIGFVVPGKVTVVSSYHWSRGRAQGRGVKVISCSEHSLRAVPNCRSANHQPPSDSLQSFPFQFYLPLLLISQARVTLPHDKKIRNSIPTSQAILIICKELMSGTV